MIAKFFNGNKMMTQFTPISAFIGGILIGLSAVLLLMMNGRIAGISGIFHGLFRPKANDVLWRVLFIVGLFAGVQIYHFYSQLQFEFRTHYPIMLLILAGWIVGIGTKLSGGCTSGHGICGIARLSRRSIVATITFILTGVITVYFLRHVVGVV